MRRRLTCSHDLGPPQARTRPWPALKATHRPQGDAPRPSLSLTLSLTHSLSHTPAPKATHRPQGDAPPSRRRTTVAHLNQRPFFLPVVFWACYYTRKAPGQGATSPPSKAPGQGAPLKAHGQGARARVCVFMFKAAGRGVALAPLTGAPSYPSKAHHRPPPKSSPVVRERGADPPLARARGERRGSKRRARPLVSREKLRTRARPLASRTPLVALASRTAQSK